jgi:predicted aspartyl protease
MTSSFAAARAAASAFAVAASALVLLALGSAGAPAAPAATEDRGHSHSAEDPNHGIAKTITLDAEVVRVPLDLDHGQPVVALMINGKGPFNFFVDSGAGGTVFNSDLAAELGLDSVGTAQIGDPNNPGGIQAKIVHVDKLQMGGATFEDFDAVAWDRQFLRGAAAPRGVLGFPLYRELLATYDFPNKQLVFTKGELPQPDGETVIGYRRVHNLPEVEITIGGEKVKAHLDSGSAGFLMLPAKYEGKVPVKGPVKEVGQARLAASTMTLRGAQLDGTFRFGGHDFVGPDIIFSELPLANCGSALLRAFAVTFDQKNERIGFAYSPGAGEAAIARSRRSPYGIRMAPGEKAEANVAGVDAGSPAEKGGLLAGDRIVTVNGKAIETVPFETRREMFRQSPLILGVVRDGKNMELTLTLPDEAKKAD